MVQITRNPFDQSVVCELTMDDNQSIDQKLSQAKMASDAWRKRTVAERIAIVKKGLEYFSDHADEIAHDITVQMGKPITQSRNELNAFFDRANYMLSIAEETLQADVLPVEGDLHRRIEHVPLGVVFNIAAWNYPLLVPVNVIVPALVAGNTVVLKHSERTPLCGLHFEKAFGGLEVPNLLVNLNMTREQTANVIADSRINHVAFTGSVAGGNAIYQYAAKRFIDAGLELGGKDAAYVAEDADVAYAAENIVDGACYNAGQSCCGIERVYVHEKHFDDFVVKVQSHMGEYILADPLDENTTMGPMAIPSSVEFLQEQVNAAVKQGAKLLLGGDASNVPNGFFPPSLLIDLPHDVSLIQDESFGPILPIIKVSSDDEALELMHDTQFGLTASVWTSDDARAERFAEHLDVGTVFQNRCDFLDPALPWTGCRDSGKGSSLSKYGYYNLTRKKSINFRRLPSSLRGTK